MAQQAFGDTIAPANVASFNGSGSYNDGVAVPTGRAMANGDNRVACMGIVFYLGGQGAARSAALHVGGATLGVTVPASNGGQAVGGAIAPVLLTPGTTRVAYEVNGFTYFGWNSLAGRTLVELSGGSRANAQLAGYYDWAQAPSAPGTPVLVLGPAGAVTVSWLGPGDEGGTPVTGFALQYATNSSFTGATTIFPGKVGTKTLSLSPGVQYWFRVAAGNAVTNLVSQTGPYSAASTAVMLSGGKVRVAGAWKPGIAKVRVGGVWKNAVVKVRESGTWKNAL